MKKSSSVFLAIVILIASVALVAAATQLVVNGDFATGDLTGWTKGAGNANIGAVGSPCGEQVARVFTTAQGTLANIYQCISPLPGGISDWYLTADVQLLAGNNTGVSAIFLDGANCTGSPTHTEFVGTAAAGALTTYSQAFTYDPTGAAVSILIDAATSSMAGSASGCFDNIAFYDGDPTAITLSSVDAQSAANSPWLVVLITSALVILIASALLVRQRLTLRREQQA